MSAARPADDDTPSGRSSTASSAWARTRRCSTRRPARRSTPSTTSATAASIRGLQFIPTPVRPRRADRAGSRVGQGHQDQFIAEMAQWGMPADRKFRVDGKDYTFDDFVRHSQMRASVTDNQELSWAIVIVGQYFGTDTAGRTARRDAALRGPGPLRAGRSRWTRRPAAARTGCSA